MEEEKLYSLVARLISKAGFVSLVKFILLSIKFYGKGNVQQVASKMDQLVSLFVMGGGLLLVLFTSAWLLQLRTGNAAIVDTIWSGSFPLLAMLYFVLVDGHSPRQLLILFMVVLWGVRLALYLFGRTAGQPEDSRYTTLRQTWGDRHQIMMLRFFYMQGALALLLSLPFALINLNTNPSIRTIEWAGAIVWLIGVVGESLADYQLKIFKSVPANKGKICNAGLWYYSRHPNYFFEWLVWVGYFIMALGSAWGWLTFLCPALMLYFLLKVTGIGYTEAQLLKSKGEAYVKYQKTTSAFVPLPKRKL